MRVALTITPPVRDATLLTAGLVAAIVVGSAGGVHLDPALFGYLAATLVAAWGTTYRVSAFWRRPASAMYARALAVGLRDPSRLRSVLGHARRDLGTQAFLARRSRARWLAHLLLSFGTLASFAITLPLVWGWLRFAAEGQTTYRVLVLGVPVARFPIASAQGWLVFHALGLAGIAVALGATFFLSQRYRARALPETTTAFHIAPLLLLLAVAVSGLALPVTRDDPGAFRVVAALHEALVVGLLVAIPFSKLAHLLIRPLQIGARLVRAPDAPQALCATCGGPLAPVAQLRAVERLLAERGLAFGGHQRTCPACRRRQLAAAQATLLEASFQPPLLDGRPTTRRSGEEAA